MAIRYGQMRKFAGKVCALAVGVSILSLSCSPVRQIRPLEKGEVSATLGLGGPFTHAFGVYIPLPLLGIGANVGLGHGIDVEAGFGLTSALFGIAHLDAGVNYRPWLSKRFRPGLLLSPKVFFLTDFEPNSIRVFPTMGLTAFWELKPHWFCYLGMDNWFEFHSTREDGQEQNTHWLPAFHVGVDLGNRKWAFQLEGKLYIPNLPNTHRSVDNAGIADHGALGVFLGVTRFFGGKGRK